MHSSIESLFENLAEKLQLHLSQKYEERVTVAREEETAETVGDPLTWSWILSVDSTSRISLTATIDTWRELCNLLGEVAADDVQNEFQSWLTPAIDESAKSLFGSEVSCSEESGPDGLPGDWLSVPFSIRWASGREATLRVSINPDLEAALGASDHAGAGASDDPGQDQTRNPLAAHSAEILMDVEMPVNISLGRKKIRLKELLEVTNGSVVELDEDLSAEVEIRVNNHIIAYGEIVAVEGNYAVRIVRMAQAKNTGLRGILPERAA